MKRNKKGVELSVNIIIIAAIALVVLVVMFAIFTGRLSIFNLGVKDCAGKGGRCVAKTAGCSEDEQMIYGTDCAKTEICCISIGQKK